MKITTLIFDLGNVLVIKHPEWAAQKFAKFNGLPLEANLKIMKEDLVYMRGKITPARFARKHLRESNLPISEREFHKIFTNVFTLNKPVFKFLKKLKRKAELVMFSNTEKPTLDFLKKQYPGLFSLFGRCLFFSCELHMVKPQKEIYRLVLKKVQAKPKEVVFIDDNRTYVQAARRLGINAFQYKSLRKLKKDLKTTGLAI